MPEISLNAPLIILLITVGTSLWALSDQRVMGLLINSPVLIVQQRQWYRVFSHALIHADYWHLGINMFVFHWTSQNVLRSFEKAFPGMGTVIFLLLYAGGVAFAVLPSVRKHKDNEHYFSLGASGAVAAILLSYILFNPDKDIYLYGILGIPAWFAGIAYLGYEYWMDKRKKRDRVAHDAHFWGALFGVGFTLLVKPDQLGKFFEALLDGLPF